MISFIVIPPYPYDVEDEDAALKKTTNCDAIGDRVERDHDGG
jgi:hypothetical protein